MTVQTVNRGASRNYLMLSSHCAFLSKRDRMSWVFTTNTALTCGTAAPREQSLVYEVPLVRKRQVRREGVIANCTAEVEKLNLEEEGSGFDQISWDSGKGKDTVVHLNLYWPKCATFKPCGASSTPSALVSLPVSFLQQTCMPSQLCKCPALMEGNLWSPKQDSAQGIPLLWHLFWSDLIHLISLIQCLLLWH